MLVRGVARMEPGRWSRTLSFGLAVQLSGHVMRCGSIARNSANEIKCLLVEWLRFGPGTENRYFTSLEFATWVTTVSGHLNCELWPVTVSKRVCRCCRVKWSNITQCRSLARNHLLIYSPYVYDTSYSSLNVRVDTDWTVVDRGHASPSLLERGQAVCFWLDILNYFRFYWAQPTRWVQMRHTASQPWTNESLSLLIITLIKQARSNGDREFSTLFSLSFGFERLNQACLLARQLASFQ